MVGSFLRFFVPLYLTLYVSAFTIVAPPMADVDRFNNIAANWTWSEGDPTRVLVHLFLRTSEDVCVFGKANPVDSKGIQGDIQSAVKVDGKKNGTIIYQADKIGEYILCAYEDFTPPGGRTNLSSIANSGVFSVSRPTITQTTVISSTSNIPDSSSEMSSTANAASGSASRISGGIIAGAVIGGVCLAGLLVAAFVVYRRMRYRRRVIAFHKERMAITPPLSNFGSADMTEKGFSIRTISSFGDGHPRSPQSFSTQNTLQPLRRPPV